MAYPISDVPRRIVYSGSAGVGPYAFTFEVLANTDIAVYKNQTLLTLTTDYTVSINTGTGTGTVTLVVAATGSDTVTIVGDRAIQRTSDFVTGGDLFANTLNDELDAQTIYAQQIDEKADRAIKSRLTDPIALDMTLPTALSRANKLMGFTGTGTPAISTRTIAEVDAAVSSFVNATGNNAASILYDPPGITGTAQAGASAAITLASGASASDDTYNGYRIEITGGTGSGQVRTISDYVGATKVATVSAAWVTTPDATSVYNLSLSTTVQAKLRETVSVKDFGAVGDGVADDTAAIQAAITYAKTLVAPRLIIDNGTYLTSGTLSFDLPNYSTMEFLGVIRTATGNPAVRIGSTSTNPNGYTVTGIKVERLTNDTTSGSVGVQIRNVVASHIDIRRVTGFQDGVLCYADQGNGGISYNEIHLGLIHDNRYNLHLQAVGAGGYVNENVFVGGTFNHSSGYPAVSTVNIWIDYATYRNNNNRFICPSLEDNSTLGVAAIINGDNNLILHPRIERIASQSTYEIQFTANSSENQIIGAGFTMVPTNISDAGSGNCYETRQNVVIQKQTGAGEGLLCLRSTSTSSARVLVAEDSGGTARAWVLGDGSIVSSTRGYFESGIRYSTSSGSLNDRGLFVGSGSPNGVVTAEPGSLYTDTAGGANTTLWVKESGSGNTGWVAK